MRLDILYDFSRRELDAIAGESSEKFATLIAISKLAIYRTFDFKCLEVLCMTAEDAFKIMIECFYRHGIWLARRASLCHLNIHRHSEQHLYPAMSRLSYEIASRQ